MKKIGVENVDFVCGMNSILVDLREVEIPYCLVLI